MKMTAVEMTAVPTAAARPNGLEAQMSYPSLEDRVVLAVGTSLLVLMFITGGARFYTKARILKNATTDDWIIAISIILSSVYYALAVCAIKLLRISNDGPGKSGIPVPSDQFLVIGLCLNCLPGLIWAFVKSAFFVMYLRVFSPLRWMRRACVGGLVLCWGFNLSVVAANIYFGVPRKDQSLLEAAINFDQLDRRTITKIPLTALSLALDIYILILPMFAIESLHMSRAQKLGIVAVFALGGIACVASAINVYFSVRLRQNMSNFAGYIIPVVLANFVEMTIGVIAACLPVCRRLVFRKNKGSLNQCTPSCAGAPRFVLLNRFSPQMRALWEKLAMRRDNNSQRQCGGEEKDNQAS